MSTMNYKKWLYRVSVLAVCCFMFTGCHMSHEWQEATCSEPRHCSVCGITEGEPLEHTWIEATCAEAKHCSVCEETEGEALEHTWIEANYQQPAICEVCGETEGEPLKADLADVTLNLIELDKPFNYVRPCSSEPSENTVLESVFKDYSCFISDDTHEAVDGYVWQTLTFEMKMNDYKGWLYGAKGIMSVTTSYYDIAKTKESYNYEESTFTVNFNGVDYSDCKESITFEWSGWDANVWNDNNPPCNTFTLYYECRVPEGYDGIVYNLVGSGINDEMDLLDPEKQDQIEYTLRLPVAVPE